MSVCSRTQQSGGGAALAICRIIGIRNRRRVSIGSGSDGGSSEVLTCPPLHMLSPFIDQCDNWRIIQNSFICRGQPRSVIARILFLPESQLPVHFYRAQI